MESNKDSILNALRDFFSGKKSKKGKQVFNSWFRSFDDSKGYLSQLTEKERAEYKNRIFHSVKNNISRDYSSKTNRYPLKTSRTVWFKMAAVILMGVMLSVAGLYTGIKYFDNETGEVLIEKYNPSGQISEIILSDGSSVWLSTESTLIYPEQFNENQREVTLHGEAYFEVEHNPDRPFSVNSGPLSTNVLGTSFNIKAYDDDSDIAITLITGKVQVIDKVNNGIIELDPDEVVRFDKAKGFGAVEQTNGALATAWTNKELVFMRESFTTIARTFERWYGVEFVFEDEEIKNEEFVYHFKEFSLKNSMSVLSKLGGFDYRIEQDRVYITEPNN